MFNRTLHQEGQDEGQGIDVWVEDGSVVVDIAVFPERSPKSYTPAEADRLVISLLGGANIAHGARSRTLSEKDRRNLAAYVLAATTEL